ncbi:hypothetical protein [Corynebacterium confusum]|uniref:hypothetical protein n=1 Tax=Corynebacterium confusum TaxID=71254 RepID=UPI0025B2B45A|nr:hypothetical protein [Corynebacterium confusum]
MKNTNYRPQPTAASTVSPSRLASEIQFTAWEDARAVTSIMRHPRSLARPLANWRPPSVSLPPVAGSPGLNVAITRHRVGPRAKARAKGYGAEREPAYVVSLRFTHAGGDFVDSTTPEAWVRAVIDKELIDAVHELSSGTAHTFIWLVDRDFRPVHSPISLFAGFDQAA